MAAYRLWVNDDGTILVRIWASGGAEVALRDEPFHVWGPPIRLIEEKVPDR